MIDNQSIIGRLMAFKGDDVLCDHVAVVELVDFTKGGIVELAVAAERLTGKPRIYLRVSLPELLAKAMAQSGSNDIT